MPTGKFTLLNIVGLKYSHTDDGIILMFVVPRKLTKALNSPNNAQSLQLIRDSVNQRRNNFR